MTAWVRRTVRGNPLLCYVALVVTVAFIAQLIATYVHG